MKKRKGREIFAWIGIRQVPILAFGQEGVEVIVKVEWAEKIVVELRVEAEDELFGQGAF